jgi:hypothetical protein
LFAKHKGEGIMMDGLISEVSAKTGFSPDQARSAVDAVLGALKARLPGPLASGLDNLVGGSAGSGAESSAGDASGTESGGLANQASASLGNLFGKKG